MPPWPVFRADHVAQEASPGLGVQERKKVSYHQLGDISPSTFLPQDEVLGLRLWVRGSLCHGVTSWAVSPSPPTHTARGDISFSNDDDAQTCLLCQLPGQAYYLPLTAPPGMGP